MWCGSVKRAEPFSLPTRTREIELLDADDVADLKEA